jgi:putative ABC transport system permease protein
MFLRLLSQSFLRQRRRKLLAGLAIMLGMTLATAMMAVGTDIGDKMNRELRGLGANLIVFPQEDTMDVDIGGVNLKPASEGAYLNEADLPRMKHIFWSHNILGFSPMLTASIQMPGLTEPVGILGTYFAKPIALDYETFVTGVSKTHPWWKVEGNWPNESASNGLSTEVLVGRRLAQKLSLNIGDKIKIAGHDEIATGILSTGGPEEDEVVAPIAFVQGIIGRPGAVRRVYVSALTKPEDDFARRDPRTMSGAVLERWSCSPYANSIAYQINQAWPGAHAEQIRQVAQNEGTLLSRISGLMLLVTFAAVFAAALAVSAAMAATIFERRREIGLMKSLGANNLLIATLFLCEAALLALVAGVAGFAIGELIAQRVGLAVFNTSVHFDPVLLPLVLLLAIVITFLASAGSIRRALYFEPAVVLRGDAA